MFKVCAVGIENSFGKGNLFLAFLLSVEKYVSSLHSLYQEIYFNFVQLVKRNIFLVWTDDIEEYISRLYSW